MTALNDDSAPHGRRFLHLNQDGFLAADDQYVLREFQGNPTQALQLISSWESSSKFNMGGKKKGDPPFTTGQLAGAFALIFATLPEVMNAEERAGMAHISKAPIRVILNVASAVLAAEYAAAETWFTAVGSSPSNSAYYQAGSNEAKSLLCGLPRQNIGSKHGFKGSEVGLNRLANTLKRMRKVLHAIKPNAMWWDPVRAAPQPRSNVSAVAVAAAAASKEEQPTAARARQRLIRPAASSKSKAKSEHRGDSWENSNNGNGHDGASSSDEEEEDDEDFCTTKRRRCGSRSNPRSNKRRVNAGRAIRSAPIVTPHPSTNSFFSPDGEGPLTVTWDQDDVMRLLPPSEQSLTTQPPSISVEPLASVATAPALAPAPLALAFPDDDFSANFMAMRFDDSPGNSPQDHEFNAMVGLDLGPSPFSFDAPSPFAFMTPSPR